eukprot:38988-Eustigmatos_ZCMA.PRE.1
MGRECRVVAADADEASTVAQAQGDLIQYLPSVLPIVRLSCVKGGCRLEEALQEEHSEPTCSTPSAEGTNPTLAERAFLQILCHNS